MNIQEILLAITNHLLNKMMASADIGKDLQTAIYSRDENTFASLVFPRINQQEVENMISKLEARLKKEGNHPDDMEIDVSVLFFSIFSLDPQSILILNQ